MTDPFSSFTNSFNTCIKSHYFLMSLYPFIKLNIFFVRSARYTLLLWPLLDHFSFNTEIILFYFIKIVWVSWKLFPSSILKNISSFLILRIKNISLLTVNTTIFILHHNFLIVIINITNKPIFYKTLLLRHTFPSFWNLKIFIFFFTIIFITWFISSMTFILCCNFSI